MESLDKTLTQAVKEGGYSNKFYAFLGEFYIRPTIGDECLARPGTLADDLKLSLMLANDIVSWVDPTGVTDVIGGALDISEGNYLAGALRMGSGLVPFSQSTLGCGAAGTLNKAVNLGEAGMGVNDGIQSLRNDDPMGAAMSFLGAGMSMGGMGQSFCFVAGTQVVVEILDDGTATLEPAVPPAAGSNSDASFGRWWFSARGDYTGDCSRSIQSHLHPPSPRHRPPQASGCGNGHIRPSPQPATPRAGRAGRRSRRPGSCHMK